MASVRTIAEELRFLIQRGSTASRTGCRRSTSWPGAWGRAAYPRARRSSCSTSRKAGWAKVVREVAARRVSYHRALETARALADYDVTWLEEPLPRHAYEHLRRLREVSPVPIAGSEVNQGFAELQRPWPLGWQPGLRPLWLHGRRHHQDRLTSDRSKRNFGPLEWISTCLVDFDQRRIGSTDIELSARWRP